MEWKKRGALRPLVDIYPRVEGWPNASCNPRSTSRSVSGIARSDQDPVEAAVYAVLWTNTEVPRIVASGTTARFQIGGREGFSESGRTFIVGAGAYIASADRRGIR